MLFEGKFLRRDHERHNGRVVSDDEDFTDPVYKYPEADKFDPSMELFGLHHTIKHGVTDVSSGALGRNSKEMLDSCLT